MPADAPAVRLTSPGEIAAAVPHLCGFVPTESLVAVSLRGERRRIGLTLRVDLPDGVDAEASEEVAGRLAFDGASAAVLVVYTGSAGPLPRSSLVEALRSALEQRGIAVMEALLVRDGRWLSYTCLREECCPSGGTVLDGGAAVDALAAASAYEGRAVLRDREELVASLAPPVLLAAREAEQRLDAAMSAWLADVGERGRDRVGLDAVSAISAALTCSPTDAAVAQLVVSLQDVRVRDEVGTMALDDAEALLGLLLRLAASSVAPYDVPVCTLLALVAWVRGDGALANVALDRALAGDPAYGMAGLLRAGLDGQLPPSAVKTWLRETRRALRPAGGRRRRVA